METIITSKEKLEDAIRFLEKKKNFEEADLKNHFNETCEQLNPINFIKNSIATMEQSPEFKNDLIKTSIALAVGYIIKRIIIGISDNPIRLVIGNFVQVFVYGLIIRNPEFIKKIAITFLQFLMKIRTQNQQLALQNAEA